MTLTAVFTPAPDGGYSAMVEEVPGAISEGETIEEARGNLADALRMVLECNRELARQTEEPNRFARAVGTGDSVNLAYLERHLCAHGFALDREGPTVSA